MSSVAPCAKCGTTEGYAHPGYTRPVRISGGKFGVAGKVCHRCHSALARRGIVPEPQQIKAAKPKPFYVDPAEHQGLVHLVALRFRGQGMDLDDLVGWGQLGLLKACRNFRPGRGAQFSTYAAKVIRSTLIREIRAKVPLVPIPEYMHRAIKHGPGKLPNPNLLDHFRAAIDHQARHVIADHQLEGTIAGIVAAPKAADPLDHAEAIAQAHEILASLPPCEATVLRLQYGIGCTPKSPAEIGREIGRSRETVRQIAISAMRTARQQVGVPA